MTKYGTRCASGRNGVCLLGEGVLSTRAENALCSAGVRSVADLCRMSLLDLSKVPMLGRKSIGEIREALRARGLSLAGTDGEQHPIGCFFTERDAHLVEKLTHVELVQLVKWHIAQCESAP